MVLNVDYEKTCYVPQLNSAEDESQGHFRLHNWTEVSEFASRGTGMSPTRSLVGQECSQTMTGRDWIQVTRLFRTLQSDKVSGHKSRSSVGHVFYHVAMQVGLLLYYS